MIEGVARSARHYRSSIVNSVNRCVGNYRHVLWLIGDGRSGTTWISDLLNSVLKYRELFEPFHPHFVPEAEFLKLHQYNRYCDDDEILENFARYVFSGRINHPRVESDQIRYLQKGLLIKDIFVNLLSHWVFHRFSEIQIVLLIRHPFAVACSKRTKQHWHWEDNPLSLLEQPSLVQDYLTPYAEYIRHIVRHDDYILNQVLIWAIIHWIPLRQFHENDLDVIFYENACLNPVAEISHILANKGATETIDIDESTIRRPSRMAGAESTVQQGVLPLNLWREQMSAAQVRVGREILAEFGLTDLYGDDSSPNESELQRLLQTSG